jgi:hypothetical protein
MAESESRVEDILDATLNDEPYDAAPQSRVEQQLIDLKAAIEEGGGGDIIDDSETSSDKTWSSSKISDAISGASGAVVEYLAVPGGSIPKIDYENYIIAFIGNNYAVCAYGTPYGVGTIGSYSGLTLSRTTGSTMSNAMSINNNTGKYTYVRYIRG